MLPLTITLDRLPISKSNRYRIVRMGSGPKSHATLTMTREARAFEQAVTDALQPTVDAALGAVFAEDDKVGADIAIFYNAYTKSGALKKRGYPDLDGGLKSIFDGAQTAGLFVNDRQVAICTIVRHEATYDKLVVVWKHVGTFTGGFAMPSIEGRKRWAEQSKAQELDRERGVWIPPRPPVAKCWSCDISIGVERVAEELWLYVGVHNGDPAGAVVCDVCAEELELPLRFRLMEAMALEAVPSKQRLAQVRVHAARHLGDGMLLSGAEAREFIKRRRVRPSDLALIQQFAQREELPV